MERETRWINTKDYFTPQDRLNRNIDVGAEVMGICFDSETKHLAASYSDGQIRIFNASTARYVVQCNVSQ